ncbi:MAG TPA: hypothetical protein VEW46_14875 [Pyrinomonadaceae bacterium]|nr:hypothetical protein [Pyrinomonadaceae bacterium]
MKILDNLENVRVAVVLDTFRGGPLGARLQEAAVAAVNGGRLSDDWVKYMSLFVDNKAQLERLTVEQAGEDTYFRVGRAYIASNGTCGPDTNGHTAKGVLPLIEADIVNTEPDGKIVDPPGPNPIPPEVVVRPFNIPKVPKV